MNIYNKNESQTIANTLTKMAADFAWQKSEKNSQTLLEAAEVATMVASHGDESVECQPPTTEWLVCNFLVATLHNGELNKQQKLLTNI